MHCSAFFQGATAGTPWQWFRLHRGFPEAVLVAVGADHDAFRVGGAEGELGGVAGLEEVLADAVARIDLDPLDEVLGDHRMGRGADLDLQETAVVQSASVGKIMVLLLLPRKFVP